MRKLEKLVRCTIEKILFLKMGHPRPLFVYFRLFQTLQFLQQIYVKNVHRVYDAGIQTHNLQNASLMP